MTNARLFDDLAELAGGAVGVFANLRQQLKDEARGRMGNVMGKAMNQFDLVTQDDLDRLTGMVAKARMVQDDIIKRLAAIEKKLGMAAPAAKPTPAKKPTKTKAPTKKKK